MSMNPHYFRRDAIRQPEQSTFDYREYDRSGVIFNERQYTHILDLLRGRCQIFDSEYYNFAISPEEKYSISKLHNAIHKTNNFLRQVYLGYHQKDDMRPEFTPHNEIYAFRTLYPRAKIDAGDQRFTNDRSAAAASDILPKTHGNNAKRAG